MMSKEQILFEDKDIIVCYKPAGVATQTARVGERDMVSEVANYLAASGKTKSKSYVGIVHRLDQPVEGILVFAKNQKAARVLSRQISENQTEKNYYAVVCGAHASGVTDVVKEGTLVDYLYKDGKSNTSLVVSKEHKEAKRAELYYEVRSRMAVKEFLEAGADEQRHSENMTQVSENGEEMSDIADITERELLLVKIKLVTGRHHQIRVQMSHAGMSLIGDYKYAEEQVKKLSELLQLKQVALCACELVFSHPVTGKRMRFQKMPEGTIFQKFSL